MIRSTEDLADIAIGGMEVVEDLETAKKRLRGELVEVNRMLEEAKTARDQSEATVYYTQYISILYC